MRMLTNLGLQRPRPPRALAQGRFGISGLTVINPMLGRRAAATLAIADDAISEITDGSSAASLEFAGCFALPGLIDMHVHLPPDNALKLTSGASLSYLAHGVTCIREAGDLDGSAVNAAAALRDGGIHPVPRLSWCGPFVGAGKPSFKNTILLADASDAAADAVARKVKTTGASFMKFYEGLSEPMIRALETACARHSLDIMGHVPAGLSYEAARIAEVQHFFGVPEPHTLERDTLLNRSCDWHKVDQARMETIVEVSLKHGIANTPTIVTNQRMLCYRDFAAARGRDDMQNVPPFYLDVVWHPDRGRLNNRIAPDYIDRQVVPAIRKKQQLAKMLFDAGAKLYLGTDVAQPFVLPGLSLQEEMKLFAEAGIGAEQVWRLATRDAGERLGIKGLGRIEPGAPADVLLFRRDPTATLDHLASLEAVIAGGKLYRAADLNSALQSAASYFSSPIIKPLARRGAERALARAFTRSRS